LVAVAPFVGGRSRARDRALRDTLVAAAIALVAAWLLLRAHGSGLPALTSLPGVADAPPGLASALAVQALLDLLAVVGWGRRLAKTGDDLAQWLALGFTLQLFAALHLVFTPPRGANYVAAGDYLRLLARERNRAVRLRAAALHRVPDGGWRARGGHRDRPVDPPRTGRADRDLPHRPGGTRERPSARERDPCRGRDRPPAVRRAVRRDRRRR